MFNWPKDWRSSNFEQHTTTTMPIRISGVLLILTLFFPAVVLHASTESPARESIDTCGSCCDTLRPGDDLWMLSTRHLGCPEWQSPDNPDFQAILATVEPPNP